MGINRVRPSPLDVGHPIENDQLTKRVVEVVVTADHVRDAHVMIVDHHREHICRRSIGAQDHEIIEFGVLHGDATLDAVIDHRLAVTRSLDPHDERGLGRSIDSGAVAPFAGDAERAALGLGEGAPLGQFLGRQKAAIGMACFEQLRRDLGMAVAAGELHDRRFVAFQPKPSEAIENRGDRRFG